MSTWAPSLLSLDGLAAGTTAVVSSIQGDAGLRERLAARGLSPGSQVTVVRRGDPLMVASGHSRWGITRAEAGRIEVMASPGPGGST